MRQLRKKREEEKVAFGSTSTGGVASDVAATKIIDLSKKVRDLTAELQSEKTKKQQMAKKCADMENEVKWLNCG